MFSDKPFPFGRIILGAILAAALTMHSDMAMAQESSDQTQSGTTIVDLVEATPQLSTMNEVLEAAEMKEELRGEGPFTIFLPMNQAFNKLPEEQREALTSADNSDQVRRVLNNHIIEEEKTASNLAENETVESKEEELTINSSENILQVKDANVIQTDVEAANGIIHVVDQVILPDNL